MADEEKLRQYLKKATGDLQQTARRLREVELRDSEPIAIVGMGCVFPPGLRSPAELWRFVAGEGDGISPFPRDRGWDDEASGAGQGGFITGADLFDPEFFGISEHEALAMDPQQRLLLETAWSALEDAGVDPAGLRGTRTGVYAGVSYCDYGAGPREALPAAVADQLIIGSSPSTVSGRISYTLGLRGPAISIDTACSSALVAIHLACQALRRGDCELALAGGVTVMATPSVISEFSRRGALAADGRCKPFATAADGMGFGEGAGLLMLERLSAARRNGHSVLAVIRGTAVNQDGATNGMTSPSRSAQEAVIRQALAAAELTPDQVDAVEGHGTGTVLGDSIEAEALIATYGENRPADRPLLLGSVKSNIGHTQTASGVAAVIKMVMSMRAGMHARTLHIDKPSGYVDWSDGTVVLTTEPVAWPAQGRPRRAGVSSFGISGTNAHLILEEAATADAGPDAAEPMDASAIPWVLSAKSAPALRTMAAELGEFLTTSPATIAEVGISLAHRSEFKHRAVIVADSVEARLGALAALARGEDAPGLHSDVSEEVRSQVRALGPAKVRLPGYPFQRRRYWLDAPAGRNRAGTDLVRDPVHPLLGGPIDLAGSAERRFSQTLTTQESRYALRGTPVLPPAAVAEWALAAAHHTGNALTIEDLAFGPPGVLPLNLQTTAEPGGAISGFSAGADRDWTVRFTASAGQGIPPVHSTDLDALRARMSEGDPDTLFTWLGAAGIACGPAFRQVLRRRWSAEDEALALLETEAAGPGTDRRLLDPIVLETCLLTALPLVSRDGDELWVPSSAARLTRHRELPQRVWCHARRTADGAIDLELWSDTGEPLLTVAGLRHTPAGPAPADVEPDDTASWDVAELSRLTLEDPQAALQAFTDILFTRVTTLVEGLDDDRENLRTRFPDLRLGDLGLDSLRAMRLRDQLRAVLSVDVPPQRLLGDTTVADVVDLVCRSLAARNLVVTGDEEPAAAGEIEELIL